VSRLTDVTGLSGIQLRDGSNQIRRYIQLCMKKRWLVGLMTHQYKKLPVTRRTWMQFNVMPRTPLAARINWSNLGKAQGTFSRLFLTNVFGDTLLKLQMIFGTSTSYTLLISLQCSRWECWTAGRRLCLRYISTVLSLAWLSTTSHLSVKFSELSVNMQLGALIIASS